MSIFQSFQYARNNAILRHLFSTARCALLDFQFGLSDAIGYNVLPVVVVVFSG